MAASPFLSTAYSCAPAAAVSHARHNSNLEFGSFNGLVKCQINKAQAVTKNRIMNTFMKPRPVVSRRSHNRPLQVSCQSTLETVQDIIANQLSVERANVQPETKFSELGADSLDTVEIVMSLEEKFGVSIGEQDAENISTVKQVADLIEKQKVAS